MSNHTPGPWKVEQDKKFPSIYAIRLSDGREFEATPTIREREHLANLALAAAAPDLLAFAQLIADSLHGLPNETLATMRNAALAVIAKTEVSCEEEKALKGKYHG